VTGVLLLAAALSSSCAQDADYVAALETLYDGGTDTAILSLARLSRTHPEDPMGPYLEALALCWKIEERPRSRELEPEFHGLVDRAIALADARLGENHEDVRALLARGAAHGVRSRLHLFRVEKREAAREAVRMREDLLQVLRLEPENKDALFGLGLYDYYGDVLPRLAKIVRFFLGIPGGDRERGLERIRAAREGAVFHGTEVRWQLYEIYAFYEEDPDQAREEIVDLRARYPEAPRWALMLAEHLRERLGLYAESAAVAEEIAARVASGHRNYAPVVGAMARLALGEALLLDLRPREAAAVLRQELLPRPLAPRLAPRAELALGRALELLGERKAVAAHYAAAREAEDEDVRQGAEDALASPLSESERRATLLVGEGRRLREKGRTRESLDRFRRALRLWPDCGEAALRVSEAEVEEGRYEAVAGGLRRIASSQHPSPPWLRPWAQLLLARVLEARGERGEAVKLYKQVYKYPCGQAELRRRADEGLRRDGDVPAAAPGT
jgi:tetratricopeptide (TPR) repeat protein